MNGDPIQPKYMTFEDMPGILTGSEICLGKLAEEPISGMEKMILGIDKKSRQAHVGCTVNAGENHMKVTETQ